MTYQGGIGTNCRTCGQPVTTKNARRCDVCLAKTSDRHTQRTPEKMFVSIDGEGAQTGDRMRLITLSYGREDSSSATWAGDNAKDALLWLRGQVTGTYTDSNGKQWRQVPVAFHFTWDMSVISTYFNPAEMSLVHKSTYKESNLLCDTNHMDWDDPCDKPYHRRSVADIDAVITDGGEGDVLAWDHESKLAITATPRRRFYYEYRPQGDLFNDRGTVVDIHDTGSAFVGGLLVAIDKWKPELLPQQHAVIEWGKEHRKDGTFIGEDSAKVAEYSEAECVAHARMCRQLIIAIRDAAGFMMKPGQLYGSGSVAQTAFNEHKIATNDQTAKCADIIRGITIDDIPWLDYFGGLIETPVIGMVRGHVDELDLNSAYPAVMAPSQSWPGLPCMCQGHGTWKRSRSPRTLSRGTLGHVLVSWAVDTPSTGPFLVRDADSRVYGPLTGQQIWVTLPEYQAAIKQFPNEITAHETVYWVSSCDCPPPFAWVGTLFEKRLALKKEMKNHPKGSPEWQALKCREEAIKLVINSCYGKLAQRRPKLGKYTNLHYAAMITGETRAKVRTETWLRESQGGLPVYQHTDSVLSVGGNPVSGGDDLGAWGLEDKDTFDFVIVQPGLAASVGDSSGKVATRGVSKQAFETVIKQWARDVDFTTHPRTWPVIHIDQDRMYSRRQAVSQHSEKTPHKHQAGSFLPAPMDIYIYNTEKRYINGAYQAPNRPEVWIVPPVDFVTSPIRNPEDIKLYQAELTRQERQGDLDTESSDDLTTGEEDFTPLETGASDV